MGKEVITFGNTDVEKHKFHQHKNPISIFDINIDRIEVSNKIAFGKKAFIIFGTKMVKKVRALRVMLRKMRAYRKDFDETRYMSILIKNDELLEKYIEIWNKVSKVIEKGFDSEPVYNDKYLKTKIKSCEGKINTNFHDDKVPKEGSQYTSLTVILIDSVFRTGKNYYPQVFLKKCKYVVKEKKLSKYVVEDIEICSDESDKEDSEEENFDEENSNEKIMMKKIKIFC